MKFGIPLKGEQVRKIVSETVIRGSDLLVRVVEMFSVIGIRPFFQKILPSKEPLLE